MLVQTKRILFYFYVVAGTVCEGSVHDATSKTCSCVMTHGFEPADLRA